MRTDTYSSFSHLTAHEVEGKDFQRETAVGKTSRVLVIAPHGGGIELGTSQIAQAIAKSDYSFYTFRGLKRGGNGVLHITSPRFDEPICLEMLQEASIVVTVHGCRLPKGIYLGGRDTELQRLIASELSMIRIPTRIGDHSFGGRSAKNICNLGARRQGAQLEISIGLRKQAHQLRIAKAVRCAIRRYIRILRARGEWRRKLSGETAI